MNNSKITCGCRQINAAEFLADLMLLREMIDAQIPCRHVERTLDELISKYELMVRWTDDNTV